MNSGYFTDHISDETLATLIDETLKFEKAKRSKQSKLYLAQIIAAVATVVLVVGLINLFSIFPGNEIEIEPDYGLFPNAKINMPSISDFTDIIKEAKDYSHVRFGSSKNILLLDIEWFTYEEFLEYIEEQIDFLNNIKNSDAYMQASDKEKERVDKWFTPEYIEETRKNYEKNANKIVKNGLCVSKNINGKYLPFHISYFKQDSYKYIDPDGYFIFKVYPYIPNVSYYDENYECYTKEFIKVYDKEEYENLLKKIIIPYCDNLAERGVLSQEAYDYYTTLDPLDLYVNRYFN